jgi:hypothetical protein
MPSNAHDLISPLLLGMLFKKTALVIAKGGNKNQLDSLFPKFGINTVPAESYAEAYRLIDECGDQFSFTLFGGGLSGGNETGGIKKAEFIRHVQINPRLVAMPMIVNYLNERSERAPDVIPINIIHDRLPGLVGALKAVCYKAIIMDWWNSDQPESPKYNPANRSRMYHLDGYTP